MTAQQAAQAKNHCPSYCTFDHTHGMTTHARLIAELDLPDENIAVTVHVVRGERADLVELVSAEEGGRPTVAHLDADKTRALRDAFDAALSLMVAA